MPAQQSHDERSREQGDGPPAEPRALERHASRRDREPRERQTVAERGHVRRKRAIASRNPGVWRAAALTRAPNAMPSSKLKPSS